MKRLTKPRFMLVYPLVALLFFVARPSEHLMWVGIPLILMGLAVRFWANGYVGHVKVNQTGRSSPKIGRLITAGPYAYVRHPLYFGSFLVGLGFCVIVGSWWFLALGLAALLVVYRRKVDEEEAVLHHEWAQEFERYKKAVPLWLPIGRRYPRGQGQWSWQGIAASKEIKTVVWVTVFLIVLYFWEEVFEEHEALLGKHWAWRLFLLAALLILVVGDGAFELRRRRQKRLAHR